MVKKTYILKELKKLDKLYCKAIKEGNSDLEKFYSKLALMELCGWIEQSMDDILISFKIKLKEEKNIEYLNKRIIKQNHGFEYHKHFREMLIKVDGIVGVEKIEKKVNYRKREIFEGSLGNLKPMRHNHAHTYINGTTARIHIPSESKRYFYEIYDGLKEFEKQLKKTKKI